jgi:hypothetical protein
MMFALNDYRIEFHYFVHIVFFSSMREYVLMLELLLLGISVVRYVYITAFRYCIVLRLNHAYTYSRIY